MHVSLVDEGGAPVFWDEDAAHNLSATMRSSIAGALHYAPDLMAWYAPTINAWRRANSEDVAGNGRTWGFDNRTTSIRVVGHRAGDLRFEMRLPGADTNPYLTLAGLLASVRKGLEDGLLPDEHISGSAYDLPPDESMPRNLQDATRLFAASPLVNEILTPDLVDHYRILWEHEWNVFQTTVSDWDLGRYFDRA